MQLQLRLITKRPEGDVCTRLFTSRVPQQSSWRRCIYLKPVLIYSSLRRQEQRQRCGFKHSSALVCTPRMMWLIVRSMSTQSRWRVNQNSGLRNNKIVVFPKKRKKGKRDDFDITPWQSLKLQIESCVWCKYIQIPPYSWSKSAYTHLIAIFWGAFCF